MGHHVVDRHPDGVNCCRERGVFRLQALEMRMEDAFDFRDGVRMEKGFVAEANDQFGFGAVEVTA